MAFNFGAFKSIAVAQLAPFVPPVIGQLSSIFGIGITLPGGPTSNNWNKVPVNITLYDAKNDTYIQIPVIPETLDYGDGNPIVDTVKVINLGDVDFANGVELDTLTWSSFFPGRYDEGYCVIPDIKKPTEYRNWFSTWKDESLVLQVIIPAFDINKTVKVQSFTWSGQGFEGDIAYSVTLKEYKVVVPRQVETGGTLPEKGKKIPEQRPAVADSAAATSPTEGA